MYRASQPAPSHPAGINAACTLARAFSFAFAGMQAARHMHAAMLSKLLALPLAYFDTVPTGRILNRCAGPVHTLCVLGGAAWLRGGLSGKVVSEGLGHGVWQASYVCSPL